MEMIQIDMEMPATCYDCPFCYDCCSCCLVENSEFDFEICDEQRMPYCPLKEANDDGGWVSVNDKLPEEYGNYLAVVDGEVTECTYSGPFIKGMIKGWSTCNANGLTWLRDEHVTCWMPLPEPPKEE